MRRSLYHKKYIVYHIPRTESGINPEIPYILVLRSELLSIGFNFLEFIGSSAVHLQIILKKIITSIDPISSQKKKITRNNLPHDVSIKIFYD